MINCVQPKTSPPRISINYFLMVIASVVKVESVAQEQSTQSLIFTHGYHYYSLID